MDLKSIAERLDQMPLSPYFMLGHYIVCILNVRSDLGTGSQYFSRKHPLACWISTLTCIFSSTILTNFLLNEPVISALGNTQQVLVASLMWYLIFYSPFDIIFKLCNFSPVKIILNCMDEIHNCKAISQGITHASKVFPDAYVIMAIIGVIKGNGPAFMRLLERLIRGSWSMNVLEFMNPSFGTKISAITSLVFIVNRHSELFMISQPFVLFCLISTNIYLRLSAILLGMNDLFAPIENLICLLVFGGIWDALSKALTNITTRTRQQTTSQLRARALKADILSRNGRMQTPSDFVHQVVQ